MLTVPCPPRAFFASTQGPLYRPLLQHHHADLLRSVQMRPDTALLIVGERSVVLPLAWCSCGWQGMHSVWVRLDPPLALVGEAALRLCTILVLTLLCPGAWAASS